MAVHSIDTNVASRIALITESSRSKKTDRVSLYLEFALNTFRHQTSFGICLSRPSTQNNMMNGWQRLEYTKKTAAGNLRAPPRQAILQSILEAWAELSTDMIYQNFFTKQHPEPACEWFKR